MPAKRRGNVKDWVRKTSLLTIVLAALALPAMTSNLVPQSSATSGGLDGRGGHHCWTNCAKYGKYKGQYHCHRSPCGGKDVRRHRAHGH